MQVGRLHEKAAFEPLIPGDGLDHALRRPEVAGHVIEGDRTAEHQAVRPVAGERLRLVLRKRADRERRAFGEFSEAAAQDSRPSGSTLRESPARGEKFTPLDDVIAIGADAELES